MKTLKEIHAEANRYAPDNEALREAFVNGARFMATGKYYKRRRFLLLKWTARSEA